MDYRTDDLCQWRLHYALDFSDQCFWYCRIVINCSQMQLGPLT